MPSKYYDQVVEGDGCVRIYKCTLPEVTNRTRKYFMNMLYVCPDCSKVYCYYRNDTDSRYGQLEWWEITPQRFGEIFGKIADRYTMHKLAED